MACGEALSLLPSLLLSLAVWTAAQPAPQPRPAPPPPQAFRFGISLSKTGKFAPDYATGNGNAIHGSSMMNSLGCTWCDDAEKGLRLWASIANSKAKTTKGGRTISIQLDIRDDRAEEWRCLQNYEDLAPVADILLGPCYIMWTQGVKAIAERSGKILVLWALHTDFYRVGPFIQTMINQTSTGRRLSEGAGDGAVKPLPPSGSEAAALLANASHLAAGAPACAAGFGAGCSGSIHRQLRLGGTRSAQEWLRGNFELPPHEASASSSGVRDWFLDRGAPDWLAEQLGSNLLGPEDKGRRLSSLYAAPSNFTFDVNIDEVEAAYHTLDMLYDNGARKFAFVLFNSTVGGPDARWRAAYLLAYVRAMDGTSAWGFNCGREITVPMCGQLLTYTAPDVVFHCGGEDSLLMTLSLVVAFQAPFRSFALDRPHMLIMDGVRASAKLHAVQVSPLVELVGSRPDPIFTTLDGFVTAFQEMYSAHRGQVEAPLPGYAATVLASAATLVLEALHRAPGTDAVSLAAYLKGVGEEDAPRNMLGEYYFDAGGRRIDHGKVPPFPRAGMLQFYDLPTNRFRRSDRHMHVRALEVSDHAYEECIANNGGRLGDGRCSQFIRGNLFYPTLDWITRSVFTARCVPGCIRQQSAGAAGACAPCPRGSYHNFQEMQCFPCDPGLYAEVPGLPQCSPCPSGAECSNSSEMPVAKATFFRMVVSAVDPEEFQCDREYGPRRSEVRYVRCRPAEICTGSSSPSGCIGSNTGMGCGQCSRGHTFQGIGVGARICKRCPHFGIVVVLFMLFVVIYGSLTMMLSYLGRQAADGPGYLPCSIARTSLHYVHLLGIAVEATHVDSIDIAGYFLVPIDILYRPFDLFVFDCADSETDSLRSIHNMGLLYWYLMLAGFGVIIAGHIFYWVSDFLSNSISALVDRFRRKKDPQEQEKEEREGSDDAEEAQEDEEDETPKERASRGSFSSQPGELGDTRYESENSSISEDSHTQVTSFSLLQGPGLFYTELHESLAIEVTLKSSLWRCFFAWTLLFYPVYLRGTVRVLACEFFETSSTEARMVLNYDIVCGTQEHSDATAGTSIPGVRTQTFSYIVCFVTPVLLMLLYWRCGGDAMRTIQRRRRNAIIFDGYRFNRAWWEALLFLRTGLLIIIADFARHSVRLMGMLGLTCLFFFAHFIVRPFEPRYGEAMHSFELFALVGVMMVLTIGLAEEVVNLQVSQEAFLIIAFVFNALVFVYGFLIVFVHCVSLPVEAIIESGSTVSLFTRRVHRLVQFFPGVSPVYYYNEHHMRLIDVTQLNSYEKTQLARTLKHTVSVCIDCSDKFKTWVVERAIHEAFRRAIKAREAKLRNLYCQFGTHTFKIWRVFSVTLRAPDIPPKSEDCEAQSPHAESGQVDHSCGVTVYELNNALLDVNYDITEHLPSIYGAPAREDRHGKKAHRKSGKARSPEAMLRMSMLVSSETQVWRSESSTHRRFSIGSGSSSSSSSSDSGGDEDPNDIGVQDVNPWEWASSKETSVRSSFFHRGAGSANATPTKRTRSAYLADGRLSVRDSVFSSASSTSLVSAQTIPGFRPSRRMSATGSVNVDQDEFLEEMQEDTKNFQHGLKNGRSAARQLEEELHELDRQYEELRRLHASTTIQDSGQRAVN